MRHAGHEPIYQKFFGGEPEISTTRETYQTKSIVVEKTVSWTTKKMMRDPLGRMIEVKTTATTENS